MIESVSTSKATIGGLPSRRGGAGRDGGEMDTGYVERNQAASRRIAELVARLTERDLQASIGEGWTVKGALAHLAFWDRYSAGLLDGWAANGFQAVTNNPDPVNAAAVGDWLALP